MLRKTTLVFTLAASVAALSSCDYFNNRKPSSPSGEASGISKLSGDKMEADTPLISVKTSPEMDEHAEKTAEKKAKKVEKVEKPTLKPALKPTTPSVKPTPKPTKPTATPTKSATSTVEKPATTPKPIPQGGTAASKNVKKRSGKSDVLLNPEVNATFDGGKTALSKWLKQNLLYPISAKEQGVQGTAYVQFVVEKDGSVGDVVVVKGIDKRLDAEAKRVVSSMPRWTAGKQNGQNVAVQFTLPVKFELIQ